MRLCHLPWQRFLYFFQRLCYSSLSCTRLHGCLHLLLFEPLPSPHDNLHINLFSPDDDFDSPDLLLHQFALIFILFSLLDSLLVVIFPHHQLFASGISSRAVRSMLLSLPIHLQSVI